MKFMLNNNFTRKVSQETKLVFIFILVPLYLYCGSLIGTALIKLVTQTFSLQLDINTINAYLNLIVDFSLLLIVFCMMKENIKLQWSDFKKDLKDNLIYGLVIGTALVYGVGIIGGLLTSLLGGASTSENQAIISAVIRTSPVVMAITTIFLAPILEELIFRGIIFSWLYEVHPVIAHLLTAFIFSFMHIMNAVLSGNSAEWLQIFSYFLMALVFSYLYEKRNNIFVPMITHVMNNLISVIYIFFM